jgi:hypothetical protein
MKILSLRKGFASDHSSTSYEFMAVDKPLGKAERDEVARISDKRPTSRKASFIYRGNYNDIPGGWESLMRKYYDVMYFESYDRYTLAFAFNAAPGQLDELYQYQFSYNDWDVVKIDSGDGNRIIVVLFCALQFGPYCFDDDEFEGIECPWFFKLMMEIRKQLMSGDYRILYALRENYPPEYDPEDEEDVPPPKPKDLETGADVIKSLQRFLTELY